MQHHPATSDKARFVLPAMGRCQVEVPWPARQRWHELIVTFTAVSDGTSFSRRFQRGVEPKPLKTLDILMPTGQYTVTVKASDKADGAVLFPARRVTIQAGKLSACRFGR